MRGGPWASGLGWREKGPDHTPRWDTCMACALSKLTPHIQKSLSMIVRRWSNSQRWEQSEPESSAQHLSSSRESSLRDTTRISHDLGSTSHPEAILTQGSGPSTCSSSGPRQLLPDHPRRPRTPGALGASDDATEMLLRGWSLSPQMTAPPVPPNPPPLPRRS